MKETEALEELFKMVAEHAIYRSHSFLVHDARNEFLEWKKTWVATVKENEDLRKLLELNAADLVKKNEEINAMQHIIDSVNQVIKRAGWEGGRIYEGCTCMKCTFLRGIRECEKARKA